MHDVCRRFESNECQKVAKRLPVSQISQNTFLKRQKPVQKGFNGNDSYDALVT